MFAVGILNVKEIIEYGNLTEIPMMPPFIRGVINLRGSVVPVIDLSARFGHAQSEVGKRSCIVIVEVSENDFRHDIGIMVDAVSEVLEIPASEIEPPPSFGARIRADFIQGMGKVAGKFVILLNIARVLSVEEIDPPRRRFRHRSRADGGSGGDLLQPHGDTPERDRRHGARQVSEDRLGQRNRRQRERHRARLA
jgi:purine-binding chemotaxis protein CheW